MKAENGHQETSCQLSQKSRGTSIIFTLLIFISIVRFLHGILYCQYFPFFCYFLPFNLQIFENAYIFYFSNKYNTKQVFNFTKLQVFSCKMGAQITSWYCKGKSVHKAPSRCQCTTGQWRLGNFIFIMSHWSTYSASRCAQAQAGHKDIAWRRWQNPDLYTSLTVPQFYKCEN